MSKHTPKGFIRSNKQLAYGVLLVIIIPTLVVVNSLFFIRAFNKIFTDEQYRQAVLIGQITESFIKSDINSPAKLQANIEAALQNNSEVTDIVISVVEDGTLTYQAAQNEAVLGQVNTTASAFFAIQNKVPIAQRIGKGYEQFWEIQYPIVDDDGEVDAVISIYLSTDEVDSAARSLIVQSFVLLAVIVLVIILLLASNNRLFQYAILYRRLQEIDKAKDDFISIASHELRTPITAMRNYFSMLLEGSFGKISKETKDSVGMMMGNADRLSNLVEDLLNVSRLQQGRITIEPKNIDVVQIASDAVKSLEATAQEKSLELTFHKTDEQIMAFADPERVRQAIINIIGNALKYTEAGSVAVAVAEENERVIIKVKDTGIGMSAEAQERLFEKFYRIINAKTQNITGTGLGLWLTREILQLMDGKIHIDSIENVGTQVTISLPLEKKGLENKT